MEKKTLTVFTPAYNRAHTIGRTYESLCRQTSKDFEWLVVDDGSKDNTRELVNQWIEDGKIAIRYVYKENGGMHTAHNVAYDHITTELNTCIDSDDFMPDDAVENIVTFWKKNGSDRYAGILGLDRTISGKMLGIGFPKELKSTTLAGYYAMPGTWGDMKLVLRTEVVKKYPKYPVFEGERYVSLGLLYQWIDQDYELLTLDKVLDIVDYQLDGSSSMMYQQYWKNPKGFAFIHNNDLKYVRSLKRRVQVTILYISHCIRARKWNMIQTCESPLLALACFPAGLAFYLLTWYYVKRNKLFKTRR